MTSLFVAVLVASLVGSLHCAGMCGAFVALCVSAGEGRTRPAHVLAAYHAGRLVTYTALGAAAGGLGAALDDTAALFGLQRAALLVAGIVMVVFGLGVLLQRAGVTWARLSPPPVMAALLRRGCAVATRQPPLVQGLVIGLLTTFLPCGWLYAFVAVAAGTGSVALGALSMSVFWLGTLPALTVVGAGVRVVAGPLRRHLPTAAALALVVVGLAAIHGRLRVPAPDPARPRAVPASIEHAAAAAADLDHRDLPCCADDEP